MLGGVVLSIILTPRTIGGFIGPMLSMNEYLEELGQGKLTVNLNNTEFGLLQPLKISLETMKNEIAFLFYEVIQKARELCDSVQSLNNESRKGESIAKEINGAINQIIISSQKQDELLNEMNQESSKIISLVNNASIEAESLNGYTDLMMSNLESGIEQIHSQAEQINKNKHLINSINSLVKNMKEKTGKINSIMDSIINISSQTNLLALNAAIESVRSGVHGKGFEIVSHQIRDLAEQSAESAEETRKCK